MELPERGCLGTLVSPWTKTPGGLDSWLLPIGSHICAEAPCTVPVRAGCRHSPRRVNSGCLETSVGGTPADGKTRKCNHAPSHGLPETSGHVFLFDIRDGSLAAATRDVGVEEVGAYSGRCVQDRIRPAVRSSARHRTRPAAICPRNVISAYYFKMASSSRRRVRRRETTQSRAPADQATRTMPSTVTIGI